MSTHKIIEFDTIMLEGEIHSLMEKLDEVQSHIKMVVPDEVLFQGSGEPNIRTHWGAVYFHVTMARASLKAFT